MIDAILAFSIRQRWLVVLACLGIAAFGAWNFTRLPIDAVPDITNVQVQINTSAPGFSPLETEQRITFPIETAMGGLPGLPIYPLALPLRPQPGDGRVPGRDRHLLRPAARERAYPAGEGPAPARRGDGHGAYLHGPRRDLHVHGGSEGGREETLRRGLQPH